MRFSEAFNITVTGSEEWFDPILDHDTRLFADPFLIYSSYNETPEFIGAHDAVITFFNSAFDLGARALHSKGLAYKKLVSMLHFPEPSEFCLGYSSTSTRGSGTATGFSRAIASAILESIRAGIKEISHFEQIALINEGIAADRISDITLNILKSKFVAYTQRICNELGISMENLPVPNATFDFEYRRWLTREVKLPRNPFTKRPVLLIPKKFLRDLPTINPDDFWNYVWDNYGERLRDDYNYDVKTRVRKNDIINLAKKNLHLVQEYVNFAKRRKPAPYDIVADPQGVYVWDQYASTFAKSCPLTFSLVESTEKFSGFVEHLLDRFKLFVEEHQGYKLLWDDNFSKPKPEEAAQLLFHGLVREYCRANDVDVSREVNVGKGPVDFKFSSGYRNRVLVEVKLAGNSKFWSGLKKQLPAYMKSEDINMGYFLVVVTKDKEYEKLRDIKDIAFNVGERIQGSVRVIVVDAIPGKLSASRL